MLIINLWSCVSSHLRGDPANLVPAQRGVHRGRQRIPRIHQSVLPPPLCGAASLRRMLQQRSFLLHQHKLHSREQDGKFLHSSCLTLCSITRVCCLLRSRTSKCLRKEDRNQSARLCNRPVCIITRPTPVGQPLAATGHRVNAIYTVESRTVAQSCNNYINI